MIKKCLQCGKEFKADEQKYKFCSRECSGAFHKTGELLKCKICGKEFWSIKSRVSPKYCSHNCYKTARQKGGYVSCIICGKVSYARERDLPKKRFCSQKCHHIFTRKENNYGWKGGRTISDKGYVFIHLPDHPLVKKNGYIAEHRIVVEKHIGRRLKRTEIIHHINEKRTDNRIENLFLCPNRAYHRKLHSH
jgi:endogenous inhibitor of DNA gyrase (YacG/DUF329 family)